MKTFKQYLQESGIKDPQILARLIETEYKESIPYITGRNRFFRGFHAESYGSQYRHLPWFELDQPVNRKSANTSNWYTDIFSHSPTWRGWPSRAESIVCTTSTQKADDYAVDGIMVVVPHPGSPYACANVDDIWDVEVTLFDCTQRLNRWNGIFQNIIRSHEGDNAEVLQDLAKEDQYKALQYAGTLLSETTNEGQVFRDSICERFGLEKTASFPDYWKNRRFINEINAAYSPETLGFTKARTDGRIQGAGEVWIAGKCLCINEDYMDDVISLLG